MASNNLSNSEAMAIPVADKGLKKNAISFLSNVVIGVASTAPAYSIASALGVIAGIAAFASPAILVVAFIPMLFVAVAYYYLNRADPDCGTTFSWVRQAMGPNLGWIAGWALLVTNIMVMPSQAVIAGQYSIELLGFTEPSTLGTTIVGVGWIVILTAICYFGIELSARTQLILLGTELIILVVFAGVALAKVYLGYAPSGASYPSLSWFDPFKAGGLDNAVEAFLVAVFIYWGWDTGVAVNEETSHPRTSPGRAAVASTFLLVGIYVLVAVAAMAFAGPDMLTKNKEDVLAPLGVSVLGPWLHSLLVISVLTSAAAATQTTILPAARTALSMAAAGAFPKRFAEVDERYQSPGFATLMMGGVSIAWYCCLTIISKDLLNDSILALGLLIAFYYGLTAFACPIYYWRELTKSARNFVLMGALPTVGGIVMLLVFVKSCFSLNKSDSPPILGLGAPLAIGLGSLLIGLVLMILARWAFPSFFKPRLQSPKPMM